jgi:hypothetical protein
MVAAPRYAVHNSRIAAGGNYHTAKSGISNLGFYIRAVLSGRIGWLFYYLSNRKYIGFMIEPGIAECR